MVCLFETKSTGQRNRIHVSQATAQLLIEAGKGNWIQPREDVVHVKGKGTVQTFWVLTARKAPSINELGEAGPKFVPPSITNSDDRSIASGNLSVWGDEDGENGTLNVFDLPPPTQMQQNNRLIEWNVDLLVRLLKQVVAGRDCQAPPQRKLSRNPSEYILRKDSILDEVSESITLPKFDPRAAKARARPSSVEIREEVISQLREYITIIASKYHDNPFHNFAHASHVTMSANKLLSRIVKPEDVNYHRKSVKAIASDLHDYTYGITSDPLTQFAVMFCALIHDVDHNGVSNYQLCKENLELAEKYKNRSVAEQNSVDLAWGLLMEPRFKDLQECIFADEIELTRFRQLLVNVVLATDIFDKDMKVKRNNRWEKVFHSEVESDDVTQYRNLKATIVIEHIIQAADVAHTMQHWQVFKKWNELLFNEMYAAYESGRAEKDPSEGWYNGELAFFDNYVIPLARKLEECGVFGVASEECLNYALENRKEWAVKGKDIVDAMVENFKESRKAVVNSYAVLQSQEDEIVFSTNSIDLNQEKPPESPIIKSPVVHDMSPSLKLTRVPNGISHLLPSAPNLGPDNVDELNLVEPGPDEVNLDDSIEWA